MGRVFDCFPFLDELEILNLRLKYLIDHVQVVVISQAQLTHRGEPWIPILDTSHPLIEKYRSSFDIRFVYPVEVGNSVWGREKNQRIAIDQGFFDLCQNDLILINDVDEIPSREQIKYAVQLGTECFHSIPMITSVNKIDVINRGYWKHGKAISASKFKGSQASRETVLLPSLKGGPGHHLTVINGADGWRRKFEITPHLEMLLDTSLLEGFVDCDLYPSLNGIKSIGGGRLQRIQSKNFDELLALACDLMPHCFKGDTPMYISESTKKMLVAKLWLDQRIRRKLQIEPEQKFSFLFCILLRIIYLGFLPIRVFVFVKKKSYIRSRLRKIASKMKLFSFTGKRSRKTI